MINCKRIILAIFSVTAFFLMLSCLYAQDTLIHPPGPPPGPPPGSEPIPPSMEPQAKAAPIIQVSPGVFLLGDIEINKKNKSISFPAEVNMDRGLLEYALVRRGGKTHESLLRTNIEPYNLQIAFLLLGFEPTGRPLRHQGDPDKPKGEPIEISIGYDKGGKPVTIKPEEWMIKRSKDKVTDIKRLDWIFTGSVVMNGRFMAQMESSIIAVYHDPVAIIDNASEGGESDEIWFVKEGAVPPPGTPVKVTIKGKNK
jgi:hypothetical protein